MTPENGWIVGESATILHTNDGGKHWETQLTPAIYELTNVEFMNLSDGWAVGEAGTIVRTTDSGKTWEFQVSGTAFRLEDLAFVNPVRVWAVGWLGAMVFTADGGVTWEQLPELTNNNLFSIEAVDESNIWIVGQYGTIIHSEDAGASWKFQGSNVAVDLYDTSFINASEGWSVGGGGTILHTADAGKTWQLRDSHLNIDLHDVYFSNSTHGWVVGENGFVMYTVDGGKTWESQISSTKSHLYAICSNQKMLWAMGQWGTIIKCYSKLNPLRLEGKYIDEQKVRQSENILAKGVPRTKKEEREYGEMVHVPAGEFLMGSNDGHPNEYPLHKVYVAAFYIDKYEVTNAAYKKFIDATAYGRIPPTWTEENNYPQGKANYPIVDVTWYDAIEYCKWAGKRLPTEAEWEKAARGTDGRKWPWGNNLEDINMPSCAFGVIGSKPEKSSILDMRVPRPVGSIPGAVSPYGVYDMSGNAAEWTADWYEAYPGNDQDSEWFGKEYIVIRGSFNGPANAGIPCSFRFMSKPDEGYYLSGFRCVRDVE